MCESNGSCAGKKKRRSLTRTGTDHYFLNKKINQPRYKIKCILMILTRAIHRINTTTLGESFTSGTYYNHIR